MPEFQPLDYSSAFANLPQPGDSFLKGVQGGLATQDAMLQQAMKRYQFGRMQQMQGMAAQVAQNPTPENIAQLSIAFPEMSENFKRSYDMVQPQQQRNDLNFYSQVYSAAQNGRPDLAAQLLNDRATALENSGADPQKIASTRAYAQWATTHPDSFRVASGTLLAGIMGPDKFTDAFKGIPEGQVGQNTVPAKTLDAYLQPGKTQSEIDKTNADITNMAGRLGLDRDKLMSETQVKLKELGLQYGTLQDDQRKIVNESAMSATAGEQSAARLTDLADRIQKVSDEARANGRVSDWAEIGRKTFGSEDAASALKQEYARIVNNQALGSIKEALGGRVTDVDMKVAMGSVPSPSANPEVVQSYLRGVANIQRLDAARQNAQAEWLAKGGRQQTLGPAVHDMEILGTKVPAGTTFADFSRQFIQQKAEQMAAQSSLSRAQGRSYLRFANPQAGGASGSY